MSAADVLRALHRPGEPLVLPNVWDAGSAKLVAAAGFPAVATSSAAVAESLGFTDEHGAPVAEMLAAAARVVAAVDVPVTIDFEGGYGLPPAELVERLLAAGAAGCNLEDTDHAGGGFVETARQADFLAAVRAAADAAGVPLVINARVDLFLNAADADKPALVEPALERANAYFAAGADCVYPILAGAPATVRQLVEGVDRRPVNVTYGRAGIDPATAATLGVARVSLATGLWRAHQAWLTGRLAEVAAGRSPY